MLIADSEGRSLQTPSRISKWYFLAMPTKKPRKKMTNLVAMSISSSQIMVSKYHFPLEGTRA